MLTQYQLEQFILQGIAVAGKSAETTHYALQNFLSLARSEYGDYTPLELIRKCDAGGKLAEYVRLSRLGNYAKNTKAFKVVADSGLDLRTCTAEQLEALYGIGQKTARFFLLYTREGDGLPVLDVHVLHWLRDLGYDAPKATPSDEETYRKWSFVFGEEAVKRGLTVKELDVQVWNAYSKGKDIARDSLALP